MKNLKEKRKAANITQEQLAKAVGVTQGAVNQWESGKAMPTIYKLKKIADVLGCKMEEIL